MALFYDVIFILYAAFQAPSFLLKGKHKEGWRERLGHIEPEVQCRLKDKRVVWFHAVSVGEVRLACRLMEALRKSLNGTPEEKSVFVLTTTTSSGKSVAQKIVSQKDVVLYVPLDWGPAVRRFLAGIHPSVVVLLETELWPNILSEVSTRKIPILVANGRISDKAFPKYRMARFAFRRILKSLSLCLAQSEESRRRFLALGMDPEKVRITGNMKFDLDSPVTQERLKEAVGRFLGGAHDLVFLAASTHPGEEELLLNAVQNLTDKKLGLKLILAPRHVDRMTEVQDLIDSRSIKALRLSDLSGSASSEEAQVLLVDEWGVLNQLYSLADVIFVGGSLLPHGGHNLAEAALSGKPVIHGPHLENFRDMAEVFAKNQASVVVQDQLNLENELARLAQDEGAREAQGLKARQVVIENRGATEKTLKEILACF